MYRFQNENQAQKSNISHQAQNPNNEIQNQNPNYPQQPSDSKTPLHPQNTNNIYGAYGVQVTYLAFSQMTKLIQLNIESLNIKILNFLNILRNYSKVRILCNKQCCGAPFRSIRSHKVVGINEQGEENLIMTASQEKMKCDSDGYMLIYRTNETIIGALGYQFNRECCAGCCSGGGGML